MISRKSLLITSNFSSDTGFAWKFFFRLFKVIAETVHKKKVNICLSFAKVVEPVTILGEGLPFDVFTFDPLKISLSGIMELRKNIKKSNISYAYLTDFPSWHWLYLLMRIWGIEKIVVHSHVSVAAPYRPPSEKGIRKAIKTTINASRMLSADSIYACSEFVKDRLVRVACYPEDKIHVITHGIDVDRFRSSPAAAQNGGKLTIFSVARATKEKGIHVLIEAARLLRERYRVDDFVVKYGGVGPDMEEFRATVRRYRLEDHFQFLGALEDTRENTCGADIVVVPSCWGDAYPLSVIEAMSAGKPVIATDVGGIPEEIGPDECGVLVKPYDGEALAEQLFALMGDPSKRSHLGRNARVRAERVFTEERFHGRVLDRLLRDIELAD